MTAKLAGGLLLFFSCSPLPGAESAATAAAPATNWVLPLFTDKEGFRSMTLRGSEVRPVGTKQIAVTDLSITVFSGDAAARVESILMSPAATFFPKENRASGEKTVRLIRDDIEVTGANWTYDHATQTVVIREKTRIVFREQLKDILK
jgi:hypothetical protein